MFIRMVLNTSVLWLMVSGIGLSSAWGLGFGDVWSKVQGAVDNLAEDREVDQTTEHGQTVMDTIKKYAGEPERFVDMEVRDPNSHLHTTAHHLMAAKDALEEEMDDLPEEARQKTQGFIDDIHHAMKTITTLDATHQMTADDNMDEEEGNSSEMTPEMDVENDLTHESGDAMDEVGETMDDMDY